MKKVLEIKNLTKVFKIYKSNFDRLKEIFSSSSYHDEYKSNDNISFDLYEGETLGIIGVNGAGKSTLLKQIAGVLNLTSGQIIKHGKVAALLELGTGFNDEFTGRENIFLNGMLIGMDRAECKEKLADIISFSELGKFIDEPLLTYSSGMKMRLAFSIAIFSNPKILIVDEALSVGDAHFSYKCMNALKERKKLYNMSIIYVSHDLNSLKMLCDRLILLDNGKLLHISTPQDILNHYNFLISSLNDKDSQNDDTNIKDINDNNFGNFDAQILSCSVHSLNNSSNTITSNDIASLDLNIKANKNVENVNIGFLIKDKYGQDIYGITSLDLCNKTYKIDKNIEIYVKFHINISLAPGIYNVSVALAKGINHLDECLHWIDYACEFEVLSDVMDKSIGICNLKTQIVE